MEGIPYSQIKKGSFVVATPEIDSGIFFHGVILVCEHSHTGSFGIAINKPLDIDIPEEVININQMSNPKAGIRAGGPVQTNQLMLLHDANSIIDQTIEVCDGIYLGGDLKFLQESIGDDNGPNIFLCFGYAGWETGQLEREFLDGNWLISQASAKYIFETPSERLWQTLLRDMGGKYASLSMIPEDLSLN